MVGDYTRPLPFANNSFNHVFCNGALHYAGTKANMLFALQEMLRVVRPTGSVVAGLNPDAIRMKTYQTIRSSHEFDKSSNFTTPPHLIVNPKSLVHELETGGFQVSLKKLWQEEKLADLVPNFYSLSYSYTLVISKSSSHAPLLRHHLTSSSTRSRPSRK